jgi:crotonobetainyl-CoA hydratase
MMPSLLQAREGSILLLTLDRPSTRNALDAALFDALTATLADADANPAVRCVILTGNGSVFCSGYDLREAGRPDAPLARVDESFLTLDRTTPLVAAVNGPAVGAGFELVLAADLVVATPVAWFSFPEAQLGLVAGGGGVWRLAQRIGHARTIAVAAAGERIGAEDAHTWGIVNRVVEPHALLDEARRYAHRLADAQASAVAETLALARGAYGDDEALWKQGLRPRRR